MIEVINEIENIIRELLTKEDVNKEISAAVREIYLKIKVFRNKLSSKPELDHLDIRFGEEVILSMEEILYKGYREHPLRRKTE